MGITMVLSLLSGVALFLYGMALMGDSLKKVAGNKLELILYKLTNSPIKGLLLGTVVTAIIQSSSATTVMVVGFVNSGMMKVAQAIGIIMGANIGTSITGWILCLSYIDGSSGIAQLLSTATISAIVAIIGIIFRTFVKKKPYSDIGDIMLGFAILMFGMQTMSGAVSPLKENPHFVSLLTMFKNPFMGILVGIAFTASECICICRYSSGIINHRLYYICCRTSYYNGYRCRSCLSCTAFFYRYKQERKAYSTYLPAE
jgi:phosphate:Na+ symporter